MRAGAEDVREVVAEVLVVDVFVVADLVEDLVVEDFVVDVAGLVAAGVVLVVVLVADEVWGLTVDVAVVFVELLAVGELLAIVVDLVVAVEDEALAVVVEDLAVVLVTAAAPPPGRPLSTTARSITRTVSPVGLSPHLPLEICTNALADTSMMAPPPHAPQLSYTTKGPSSRTIWVPSGRKIWTLGC